MEQTNQITSYWQHNKQNQIWSKATHTTKKENNKLIQIAKKLQTVCVLNIFSIKELNPTGEHQ